MIHTAKMKGFLLLAAIFLSLSDAARVTRTTTTSSSAARQLPFAHQPEELEDLWHHVDLQKLDKRQELWNSNSVSSTKVHPEDFISTTPKGVSQRQFYPPFPQEPGPGGEIPQPISPPITLPTRPPPILPPGCSAYRGQYSSPKSCANYINCWDGVAIEQQCPNGLLFNDKKNFCDFDYNVDCGSRPAPTPKPSLPPGSKQCPDLNGRYRSSTNCSEFYVCLAGRPIKFSCPRGLVYNDELNVCDYVYNVDCKGAASPKPLPPTSPSPGDGHPPTRPPTRPPTQPPTRPPTHPPTYPPTHPSIYPPTYPPQQPSYPPQQPSYPPQQPSYPPQQPSYPPQQPSYPPQQPSYPPQQPSYPPQQPSYPSQQPSYPGGPWLAKDDPDPWHQRPVASQIEIDEQRRKQPSITTDEQLAQEPTIPQEDEPVTNTFVNPWDSSPEIPTELSNGRHCENGAVHRLDEFCTSVLVCRDHKPHLVKCSTGFTYDKPSDSCKPFSIAKC